MDIFDEDKNRKKKNPFDEFNLDDEFFKDILNNDKIREDIQRMTEEFMRMFSNAQQGQPFVRGYKVQYGQDGKPIVEDFGNKSIHSPNGKDVISDQREPLTDVIEGDASIAVTLEIPEVEKDDIDLNITEEKLEITVDAAQRKYHKTINLPGKVKPKSTKATYKNGILDICLDKKDKKKSGSGYKVSID
jgi:HSP20 family protein